MRSVTKEAYAIVLATCKMSIEIFDCLKPACIQAIIPIQISDFYYFTLFTKFKILHTIYKKYTN